MQESPIDRICRLARERETYILAHPEEFTRQEVQNAQLSAYQRERINLASTLRYDD